MGAFALAGCAQTATSTDSNGATSGSDTSTESGTTTDSDTSTDAGGSSGSGTYADGTYTAEGSYATPETVETISVTVTLEDSIITAVEVTGEPQRAESERYQGAFIGGIADEVVGQSIDDIAVSRVAGSSLTSGGFNDAIEVIKSEAAA
ncbi:FMN-binding protein [Microbacterium sp. SLBN-146]|uniref:FMN-binding protein n=1 Tax=Microbacterium sp. SLBN-146 TaxID=2768457 RepID=UPI0016428841